MQVGHTGAVTLIQRFGSALNANIHFHMLFLEGVYVDGVNGLSARFQWTKAPRSAELTQLTHTIAQRVGRFLESEGLLERDAEISYLAGIPWKGSRWINSWVTRSRTASQWARTRAARCSRCRRCWTAMSRSLTRWARWLDSRCMRVSRRCPTNARSWGVCAATLRGQRCRKSVCRSPLMAMCVMT